MEAPRRRTPLDKPTIALVKIDYEESDLTLDEIGAKYSRSPAYICKLARYYGWLMRSDRLGRRARQSPPASEAREAIARRLSRIINTRLDQLEKGMQDGSLSPEDADRGAKTVTSMIGGFDRVLPQEDGPDEGKQKASRRGVVGGSDEVERLQREIIERFERIQQRRQSKAGSQ